MISKKTSRPTLNGVGFFCAWVFCSMRMVCALFGLGWIMVRGLATGILGYRVVWLAWFGVANRVVYEVRSGWGIAG